MNSESAIQFEFQQSLSRIIKAETLRAIAKMEHPGLPPENATIHKYSHVRTIHRDANVLIKHYWRGRLILSVKIWPTSRNGKIALSITRHLEQNQIVKPMLQYDSEQHRVKRLDEIKAG